MIDAGELPLLDSVQENEQITPSFSNNESVLNFNRLSTLTYLVIADYSMNQQGIRSLEIKNNQSLQRIQIASHCFTNVTKCTFKHLVNLTTLVIGQDSFANNTETSVFECFGCPELMELIVGEGSFDNYAEFTAYSNRPFRTD